MKLRPNLGLPPQIKHESGYKRTECSYKLPNESELNCLAVATFFTAVYLQLSPGLMLGYEFAVLLLWKFLFEHPGLMILISLRN